MLLAAMLAMVLAAAAPALAQATAGDDSDAANVQYVDCSQVQLAVGAQYGDANAAADDESIAAAANELGITQNQVNACLGEVSDVNQGDDGVGDIVVGSAEGGDDGSASAASEGSASAAAEELPETGGASLLALGAGALLVAGGLLARRIVR